jgi:hypothetical protein
MSEPLKLKVSDKTAANARETARTPLGAQLDQIRQRIVASGEPLLSWEDIEREITERRGESEQRGR